MDATQVSKSQFKAKALEFFRQVEGSGAPVIVLDNGRPVIEVRQYHPLERQPLEMLRGSVLRYEQPVEPVAEDDWEALK